METQDIKVFWYILLAGILIGIWCCLFVISIYKLNHISLTKIDDENNDPILANLEKELLDEIKKQRR